MGLLPDIFPVKKNFKMVFFMLFVLLLIAFLGLGFYYVIFFKPSEPSGPTYLVSNFISKESTISNNASGYVSVALNYANLTFDDGVYYSAQNGAKLPVAYRGSISEFSNNEVTLLNSNIKFSLDSTVPIYLISTEYSNLPYIQKVHVVDKSYLTKGSVVIFNRGIDDEFPASILIYPVAEESK